MSRDALVARPARTRYTLADFSEDQRRLVEVHQPTSRGALEPVEDWERRWYPVCVHALRQALVSADPAALFLRKYGHENAAARVRLLRALVGFLHDRRGDLTDAGLAQEGEPLLVDEEFLRYLLDAVRARGSQEIPRYALAEFLDALGHKRL